LFSEEQLKRALILLLLALTASSLAAQSRVVLSIGHAGTVRDAATHPSDQVAFTVGDDGRLLVWDIELRALLHRYQISHRPIVRVVHHPTRDEVALVVSEGVDRSSIHVINWTTGEEVFRRELHGTPVYLSYSPTGSYLIFSLPTFQSLFFLSADRGSARSYLDDGFGIVNFVQMGRTERNVMTYVPARGEFIYWSLQSGEELQRVRTQSRLTHLTLVDPVNRRALAAAGDNELVIVDNLSGEIRATYPVTPIHDIRYDTANDRIMVLTDQLGRRAILSFTYAGGRLRRDTYRPSELSPTAQFVVPLLESAGAVLSGDEIGVVDLFSTRAGRKTTLGPRPTVPILDAAFTEGRLHLSLGDHILTLVSDAFQSTARSVRVSSVRHSITQLEETTNALIERVGERLLIWGNTEQSGTILSLTPPETTAEPYYIDENENAVTAVRFTNGGPVIIHRDGRIIQLSASFPVERFRYAAVGAQVAAWDPELGLVAAKTKSNAFDSSLIRIDQLTGETVPIPSDAFLSTDIALGDRSTLYAIGLFGPPASATTRLVRYSGDRFAQNTIIDEFAGEDPNARAVWDDQTGTLFTTIGYAGLQRIEGRTPTRLDSTGQIGREIVLGGLYVATVNEDGSLSLWDRINGEFLFDIYVFENDEYLAVSSRGEFLASSAALERYLDFIPERRTRLDFNDFRLELPYRED
jgi:WD40 repeat protein